eukprot:CFRG5319T1
MVSLLKKIAVVAIASSACSLVAAQPVEETTSLTSDQQASIVNQLVAPYQAKSVTSSICKSACYLTCSALNSSLQPLCKAGCDAAC